MGDRPDPLTGARAGRARLDTLLLERDLAASRERARALIMAGHVRIDGVQVTKAGTLVARDAAIELTGPDHPWVGRGGIKLAHALDIFRLDVTGLDALDLGASTGGFTDVLLRRGARRVLALDVGHGQLDWRLRTDPRVVVRERVNARTLAPDQLPADLRVFDLVTVDVSFISLRQILPVVPSLLRPGGHVVVLVKPQFEAGRAEVGRKGIVRDPAIRSRVVREISAAARALGLATVATTPSPIAGMEGNEEIFLHLQL
jgi:23S rRNA (cytidine1920-2'-O)/16S rRNA (cytidine1409-2'-O)-methyltransferase